MIVPIYLSILEIVIGSITLVGMIITGYKVFKIVRFKNLLVLNLIMFSCLAMASCVIVASVQICQNNSEVCSENELIYLLPISLRATLFSITLLINTRLWLNHVFKIEEQV